MEPKNINNSCPAAIPPINIINDNNNNNNNNNNNHINDDVQQWLQHNQAKLPHVMREHLQWVSDRTNQFENSYLETTTPPTMKDIRNRLKKGRAASSRKSSPSMTAAMRKPTMLPVLNPLNEDRLNAILKDTTSSLSSSSSSSFLSSSGDDGAEDEKRMSQDDVDYLCQAVQGFHPGAMKGPLENWLFDSFLCSAEEIIPNGRLWLGGVATAHNKERLIDEMGVSRVLCVGGKALAFGDDDHYEPPFRDQSTMYKVIDVDDTEQAADADALGKCFSDAARFIDDGIQNGDIILVHCMAGVSRSASVVCAYLIWKYGLTVPEAIALVRSARPVATPNAAFVAQLEDFHKCQTNKQTNNESLRRR
jgi:hypothetical protein